MKDNETSVIVTGASAGVGRAAADMFARSGRKVGLIARNEERLSRAVESIKKFGGEAAYALADVADARQLEAAASFLEKKLGPVRVWVNNAMATVFSPFLDIKDEEFHRSTEVTYLGTVYGTRCALRRMYPRNQGTIIQVGSALSYRSIPLQSAYCGAKHAIRGFTDSLRSEIIHDRKNIHLCMVQLPALNTPQFCWGLTKVDRQPQPVPPIFQPEVAAEAIVWASTKRRREVLVGGSTLKAVLGNKIVPGLLDRMLAGKGYKGQLTPIKIDKNRHSNLFKTVEAAYGAHGIFDKRAKTKSTWFWVVKHRGAFLLIFGALMIAFFTVCVLFAV